MRIKVWCPRCEKSSSRDSSELCLEGSCKHCGAIVVFSQKNPNESQIVKPKSYASKGQKVLLRQLGIEPEKGTTKEQADQLLSEHAKAGRISSEVVAEVWRLEPATQKQMDLMLQLGISSSAEVTKGEAHDLIENVKNERAKRIPMTSRQKEFIKSLGGITENKMSCFQAGQYIEWLLEQQIRCTKCESLTSPFLNRCTQCSGFLAKSSSSNRVPKEIFTRPSLWEMLFGRKGK